MSIKKSELVENEMELSYDKYIADALQFNNRLETNKVVVFDNG